MDEYELYDYDDEYPCNNCPNEENCDGWESRYCCRLCHYYGTDSDCNNCDPWDI